MPDGTSSAAGDVGVARTGSWITRAMQPSTARGETSDPRSQAATSSRTTARIFGASLPDPITDGDPRDIQQDLGQGLSVRSISPGSSHTHCSCVSAVVLRAMDRHGIRSPLVSGYLLVPRGACTRSRD